MSLRVEEAGPALIPVMAALHKMSFPRPWGREELAELLAMPGAFALMGFEGEAPCGFILMRAVAGEAEILTIAVLPDRRGAGLGQLLVEDALRRAQDNGAEVCFLEVAEENAPARALYVKTGFEVSGKREGYYSAEEGAGANALIMRRALAKDGGGTGGAQS